jgi:2,4-dienoyl-CoA reductase-like NADH-dependent reductase (Old Yellow Enzyme family)
VTVPRYPRIASFKTADAFLHHVRQLGLDLPFDATLQPAGASPLARPLEADGLQAGNRFVVLPMEGWDGTSDGHPTELTRRRWQHFGESGAKVIWGGEAVAVRHDGRANPNQLVITERTLPDLAVLREHLVAAHSASFGTADDLVVGLQLTHSGRYSRPTAAGSRPRIAYRHPLLDRRLGISDSAPCFTDGELDDLIAEFVRAARDAARAGFAFVDVKHCHGYLGHELLSARDRPGRYGGSFENRLRFLRSIVEGIGAEAPGLRVGVRLSAFDMVPFRRGPADVGEPETPDTDYRCAFGFTPVGADGVIDDSDALLTALERLGVRWVCLTAGSPYYNPHIQRPALFPPSDAYLPPEDPLAGVARQIRATALLKARHPSMVIVGSAYSYLQEWLPNVAQAVVRTGRADAVGIGRLVLSYPRFPADLLEDRPLKRHLLCRTFSDCTTAPRNGLPSGCYPLDRFYADRPAGERLRAIKATLKLVDR